jgi:hypothetical protein
MTGFRFYRRYAELIRDRFLETHIYAVAGILIQVETVRYIVCSFFLLHLAESDEHAPID